MRDDAGTFYASTNGGVFGDKVHAICLCSVTYCTKWGIVAGPFSFYPVLSSDQLAFCTVCFRRHHTSIKTYITVEAVVRDKHHWIECYCVGSGAPEHKK